MNLTDRDHQKKSSTAEMKNVQNSLPVMSDVTDDTTTDESDPEVSPRKPKTSLKESPSALGPRTSSSGKLTNDGLHFDVAHKSAISPSESEFAIKLKPSDLTTNSNLAEKDLSSIGVQKLKSRLGRIGGKRKLIDGEAEATAPNELILSPTSKRDININESANAQQVSNSEISGLMRREQASVQPKSPSLPRETSQDRANRKREKLQRELENSTNVTAKKKRKF